MKRSGESPSEDGPFLIHTSTKRNTQEQDEPIGNTFFDEEDSGIKSGEDININSNLLRCA